MPSNSLKKTNYLSLHYFYIVFSLTLLFMSLIPILLVSIIQPKLGESNFRYSFTPSDHAPSPTFFLQQKQTLLSKFNISF